MIENLVNKFIMPFIVIVLVISAVLLSYAVYQECVSEKLVLTKSKWTCTHQVKKTITSGNWVGKVYIPTSTVYYECMNYKRN